MSKIRIISVGLSIVSVAWTLQFAFTHVWRANLIQGHTVPATEGPSAMVRALRPNYPYSVVAGGVYSPAELKFAHGRDRVVQLHYADFDLAHAHLVTLTDDRLQYVSYRVKDKVYWTKNQLRIPRGELLLTDGIHFARTRCGNRLSDEPHQAEVNPHEPERAQLDQPTATPETLPKMAMANAPALHEMTDTATPAGAPAADGRLHPNDVVGLPGAHSVPVEPWGPVATGFPTSPVSTSGPVLLGGGPTPTLGGSSPVTTNPITSIPVTSNPVNPTPVINPTSGTDPTAVPEPSTVWLFLLSLSVSGFALLRMTPKDDDQSSGSKS
jgi:hypothetical protein